MVATRVAAQGFGSSASGGSSHTESGSSMPGTPNSSAAGSSKSADMGWYQYDKTVMRDLLARDTVYDPAKATMVRKNETHWRDTGCAGSSSATVAEILNFSEVHTRLVTSHQKE